MKNALSLSAVLLFLVASSVVANQETAITEIKTLIEQSYVHGAFNELNPEALEKGFHADFAIFSPKGEDIRKYPIADWVERTASKKADPEFDASANK